MSKIDISRECLVRFERCRAGHEFLTGSFMTYEEFLNFLLHGFEQRYRPVREPENIPSEPEN